MTQRPSPDAPRSPSIVAAVVSLAAGLVSYSALFLQFTVVAWICAALGLYAGIRGVRRAHGTAPGLPLAILGILISSIMLLLLAGLLVLFLSRPWRY